MHAPCAPDGRASRSGEHEGNVLRAAHVLVPPRKQFDTGADVVTRLSHGLGRSERSAMCRKLCEGRDEGSTHDSVPVLPSSQDIRLKLCIPTLELAVDHFRGLSRVEVAVCSCSRCLRLLMPYLGFTAQGYVCMLLTEPGEALWPILTREEGPVAASSPPGVSFGRSMPQGRIGSSIQFPLTHESVSTCSHCYTRRFPSVYFDENQQELRRKNSADRFDRQDPVLCML